MKTPFEITGTIQHYHWGKTGKDSLVAKLTNNTDQNNTFAELWFGAHPKAPSVANLSNGKVSFDKLLATQARDILGDTTVDKFGAGLPYLFKILSVASPLSIQAHPDKKLAEALHSKMAADYPDANHKPELIIALTEFKLLYGFRPLNEINEVFNKFALIEKLFTKDLLEEKRDQFDKSTYQNILQKIFSAVLRQDVKIRRDVVLSLQNLLNTINDKSSQEMLFLDLVKSFGPEDPGILVSMFMNFITLQPGEALFILPNTLHAHIKGDVVECMANSDNVVRGGLTPKKIDTTTLIEMLSYQESFVSPLKASVDSKILQFSSYKNLTPEFEVSLVSGSCEIDSDYVSASSKLLFCLEGKIEIGSKPNALTLSAGKAGFLPAGLKTHISFDQAKSFLVSIPT